MFIHIETYTRYQRNTDSGRDFGVIQNVEYIVNPSKNVDRKKSLNL